MNIERINPAKPGRPLRVLDLFCGAGGAAMGYYRAFREVGVEITGVDIRPQRRYPFRFVQGDALEMLERLGEYDFIHASPPCQRWSVATPNPNRHPDLLTPTLEALRVSGKPYVVENVPKAPLRVSVMLCGTMFGLGVFRHRVFECSFFVRQPEHPKHEGVLGETHFTVAGGAGKWRKVGSRKVSRGSLDDWRRAMGIDWMTRAELVEAIPPAYTEYIGGQFLKHRKEPS